MKANTGISEKNAKEVASILNKILADEFLLYTKTRNYHWNIEGPNFMEIHKILESQYEALMKSLMKLQSVSVSSAIMHKEG
ncbi:MAG: ferritin-like domain-containing protein [Ferruginibacter sp.]